ncbi:MAG: hypothetical protein PHV16_01555 [Candidatus Nanoarchaeia archaeon]|nr:hypothetical protein [Candidatus Nanoarchaeia archaeon]
MRKKICLNMIIFLFMLLIVSSEVTAPPEPHNVKGRVFHLDSITGVQNEIPVQIKNINTSQETLTYVYAPNIPSLKGAYSATINASDNDLINVTSWNSTYYGHSTAYILPTTTEVDVVLNNLRPSETKATITSPENNSIFNISRITEITAEIEIKGGQNGINCYAMLNISNKNILDISEGESYLHYLGNANIGSILTTEWEVIGINEGVTNISLSSYCDSDGINFDKQDSDYVYDVTLADEIAPIINLTYPEQQDNLSYSQNPISFIYNVTDDSGISNCSLIINESSVKTNYTVEKGISQYFYETLDIGDYAWKVECYDNSTSKIKGSSNTYNFSVLPNLNPIISNLQTDDNIDLNHGSVKLVYCNFTVSDNDGVDDIEEINVTLYHNSVSPENEDDNNNHYTNNSCVIANSAEKSQDYVCSFSMYYYSNPGQWKCNITVNDKSKADDTAETTLNVNELTALYISESVIDYGELKAENVSEDDVNLTITNYGNKDINISLEGYAISEQDGLGMICEQSNISVEYQRYSTQFNQDYNEMVGLTSAAQQIEGFTIPQKTNDLVYEDDQTRVYWKIKIPAGARGNCTGRIKIIAIPN